MSRKDTKLPSVGAEFAVLSNLLFNEIETHKSYHNQKGYDLISVNFETNKNAKLDKKGNRYLLLKKISNYNKFENNWDSIKKFLI